MTLWELFGLKQYHFTITTSLILQSSFYNYTQIFVSLLVVRQKSLKIELLTDQDLFSSFQRYWSPSWMQTISLVAASTWPLPYPTTGLRRICISQNRWQHYVWCKCLVETNRKYARTITSQNVGEGDLDRIQQPISFMTVFRKITRSLIQTATRCRQTETCVRLIAK